MGGVDLDWNELLAVNQRCVTQSHTGVQLIYEPRDASPPPFPPLSLHPTRPCLSVSEQMKHLYAAQYEVTFCFTPVLTFNSEDNGQEGKAIIRAGLMYFNVQPS